MIHVDVEDLVREEVFGKFKCFLSFQMSNDSINLLRELSVAIHLFYFLFIFEKGLATFTTALWNRLLMHYILKVINIGLKIECGMARTLYEVRTQ